MFSADLGVTPSSAANYIEDVFSTYLYTGNGSIQTITNGINTASKGGLVWMKGRSGATDHALYDTSRGVGNGLASNTTAAQTTGSGILAFGLNGFSIDSLAKVNTSAATYTSWTFREQANFFDIVTYTGTGANRTIAHNLGSVPGCIMIKRTNITSAWAVYHRGPGPSQYMVLNTTAMPVTSTTYWNNTPPTSSEFGVGTSTDVNASGGTYVAYLFAHNAGGFGATGTDNVISCGQFTTDGSGNATVSLGYEPQFVIVKPTSQLGSWTIVDSMRGNATLNGSVPTESILEASSAVLENSSYGYANPTSTGFVSAGWGGPINFIYIAIRRGPMKTPTVGTSVFSPIAVNAITGTKQTTNFPVDMQISSNRAGVGTSLMGQTSDRLRGVSTNATESGRRLSTWSTAAESTAAAIPTLFWDNTGFQIPSAASGLNEIFWSFRRAPGFFDVVCYTGTGAASIVLNHNLTVIPEIYIIKARNAVGDWQTLFNVSGTQYRFWSGAVPVSGLNLTTASTNTSSLGGLTSTTFTPTFYMGNTHTNSAGVNYVAYLFASVAGVSKVGSYTGTGTTNQINCGFTGGARFVLIKRTDSTGDWYVWDSARGIIAGNDPYLLLNSNAAEVTSTDYVDTYSAGFEISSTAPAAINANGGSFIFLAIA
jgi:hypothetical protein